MNRKNKTMDKLNSSDIKRILTKIKDLMIENEEYLFKLDSTMGDGDLGITMKKGFNKVVEEVSNLKEDSVGKILIKAGMAISSVASSTIGTLVATGFMRAGKIVIDRTEINLNDLANMMDAFVNGIMERGKSKPGEKTIIDSLYPAAKALKSAVKNKKNLKESFIDAYRSAVEGLEATKKMTSVHGKAVYHTERASGTEDPGAVAGVLIIKGFNDYLSEK